MAASQSSASLGTRHSTNDAAAASGGDASHQRKNKSRFRSSATPTSATNRSHYDAPESGRSRSRSTTPTNATPSNASSRSATPTNASAGTSQDATCQASFQEPSSPPKTTCAIQGCIMGADMLPGHKCHDKCGRLLHNLCAQERDLCDDNNELDVCCSEECKRSEKQMKHKLGNCSASALETFTKVPIPQEADDTDFFALPCDEASRVVVPVLLHQARVPRTRLSRRRSFQVASSK